MGERDSNEMTFVDRDSSEVKADASTEETQRRLASGELSHKAPDDKAYTERRNQDQVSEDRHRPEIHDRADG